MAKLINLNPDKSRRRALKKAGEPYAQDPHSGQLNLFEEPQPDSRVQSILAFSDPFVKGLYLHDLDHPKAEEAYLDAINRGVHIADAYCNLAIIYAGRGQDLKAIEALSTALVNDPRHAESHYNLGNLYLDAGDLQLSRLHYEMALSIHPYFPEAYFNLGILYLIRNDRSKAVEMLQYFEELVPGGLDELEELLSGKG